MCANSSLAALFELRAKVAHIIYICDARVDALLGCIRAHCSYYERLVRDSVILLSARDGFRVINESSVLACAAHA